jgi:hypothetical protein
MFVVVELQEAFHIYFTGPLSPIPSPKIRPKAEDNIRYGNCVLVSQYTKILPKKFAYIAPSYKYIHVATNYHLFSVYPSTNAHNKMQLKHKS